MGMIRTFQNIRLFSHPDGRRDNILVSMHPNAALTGWRRPSSEAAKFFEAAEAEFRSGGAEAFLKISQLWIRMKPS